MAKVRGFHAERRLAFCFHANSFVNVVDFCDNPTENIQEFVFQGNHKGLFPHNKPIKYRYLLGNKSRCP